MINLTQWTADAERQEHLKKLLDDPIMQEALTLVRAQCLPRPREVDNPEHVVTLYALDHSRATGWYDAINFLLSLQRLGSKPDLSLPQPWKKKEPKKTK